MYNETEALSLMFKLQTSDINMMLENLDPNIRAFKSNEAIMNPSSTNDSLGLVLNGTALLIGENGAADKRIVEYFEKDDIFGKHMLLNLEDSLCYVIAKHKCTIAFFSYRKLLAYCAANRSATVRIMDYLFRGSECKALAHIYILQQRTLREKILLYFYRLCKEYGANHFTLPIPFVDLADYLSVDRSSLMREIMKLNREGIIKSDRRKIKFLDTKEISKTF